MGSNDRWDGKPLLGFHASAIVTGRKAKHRYGKLWKSSLIDSVFLLKGKLNHH